MDDFQTEKTNQAEAAENKVHDNYRIRVLAFLKHLFKRIVMLVAFGPGVLGVLWLIGRILRR